MADEVGLGKTVVATGVVERLAHKAGKPITVFYVANGPTVAHQNRDRLVDFLPRDDRKRAISRADRLGLIPLTARPRGRVVVYSLTPGTSFPDSNARLSGGKKEERAFIVALIRRALPRLLPRIKPNVLQGGVAREETWLALLDAKRKAANDAPKGLVGAFRVALGKEFGQPVREKVAEASWSESGRRFAGRLRRALAEAALLAMPPDLIIFDEFQRYRALLSNAGRSDRLVKALLDGRRGNPPALLLLSATPYRQYVSRWEEARGIEAQSEFFELIEFLAGNRGADVRRDAEDAFRAFGSALRGIASLPRASPDLPVVERQARDAREAIHRILAPLMARTERRITAADLDRTHLLQAPLQPSDIRVYRHLIEGFAKVDRSDAIAYWSSIPLPAQAMGKRYEASRRAKFRRDGRLVKLTPGMRDRLEAPTAWPSPKLRALEELAKPEYLSLPWCRPSKSWWPLGKGWEAPQDTKMLVFSRFRATPPAVAALTSFGVEARYLSKVRGGYEGSWNRSRLEAGSRGPSVMALFHPSPFLALATDPLLGAGGTLSHARTAVSRQLKSALAALGVKIETDRKARGRDRQAWELIAGLDRLAGYQAHSRSAWDGVTAAGMKDVVARWHGAVPPTGLTRNEFRKVLTYAMSAPGAVLARSVLRHAPDKLLSAGLPELVDASWNGLRLYLDKSVFRARLPGKTFPEALLQAVVDGGLEAALDEHLWLRRGTEPSAEALLKDLKTSFGVGRSSFQFDQVGAVATARKLRIRCHVAVPFGATESAKDQRDAKGEDRADDLRVAFNSPFWPYVLSTTSVGQEGLDFHSWCSRIGHWDLCSSPVDLEQREGRVQRFASLAIRRALAGLTGEAALAQVSSMHESLWSRIQATAEQEHADDTGLAPWWTLPDAEIGRYVFGLKMGRDSARHARLREARLLYRLALGQPNAEDLVDRLASSDPARLSLLRELSLDLSALRRER
ncbi:hypothetical protein, partial [Falsiroseomonas sp. HW251]|uniref:hypothetical protein n=1 Tax=Falsiroseomonas sp. HW251 TaxID=3390998 RepID=UPI003D3130A6